MRIVVISLLLIGMGLLNIGCARVGRERPETGMALAASVISLPGVVETDTGAVRGARAGGTYVYKGVPYAAPPLDALRFRPPQPHPHWEGVRDALAFSAKCPQVDNDQYVGDEDCLYLNVWTPTTPDAPRPVMVFIHGGGNSIGSAHQTVLGRLLYDGQYLVETGGVIVVTINYRLNAFGYLAHPALSAESPRGVSGNYGILDQVTALQWVQRNAAAFGGDPHRVMIFGESAGAVNVCTLLASPLAAGLFHAAVMQSGSCHQEPLSQAEAVGQEVAATVGCVGDDVVACLRSQSAETLTRARLLSEDVVLTGRPIYGPNVDGYVLVKDPIQALREGAFNHMPFIVGANKDETGASAPNITTEQQYRSLVLARYGPALGALILAQYPVADYANPKAAYVALTSDARFICPARTIAQAADTGQNEPVYRYFFSYDEAADGATHGLELLFVFHSLVGMPGYQPDSDELALSDAMVGYWSRFAEDGNPNGGSAPVWPVYDSAFDQHIVLDWPLSSSAGVRTRQCDFWDSLLAGVSPTPTPTPRPFRHLLPYLRR